MPLLRQKSSTITTAAAMLSLALLAGATQPGDPAPQQPVPALPQAVPPAPESPEPEATEPETEPAVEPEADPEIQPTPIDALLNALRDRGDTLQRFSASSISHEKFFFAQQDIQTRYGSLAVWRPEDAPEAGYRFSVTYTDTVLGDGPGSQRISGEISYTFDGEYLIEMDAIARQFIARRVTPPGRPVDPFKLGEGQFPLPIGQDPAEIRRRFEVSLLEPEDGIDDPAHMQFIRSRTVDLRQIRLVTRPAFSESFPHREYRFWLDAALLTPVMIRTESRELNIETWRLLNIRVNDDARIDPALLNRRPPPGWEVMIHEQPMIEPD